MMANPVYRNAAAFLLICSSFACAKDAQMIQLNCYERNLAATEKEVGQQLNSLASGGLSGVVQTESGDPVVGAIVTVKTSCYERALYCASGVNGEFAFESVPACTRAKMIVEAIGFDCIEVTGLSIRRNFDTTICVTVSGTGKVSID